MRGVRCRIGIEIDSNRSAVRPVIDGDRQVLDRPEREIVRNGTTAGKAEIIVEPHDVQAQPEQCSAIDRAAKSSPQVCYLIELMLKSSADLKRALIYDLRHGHAGMDGQTQRQHV